VLGMPYDPRTAEAIDLVVVADPAQEGVVLEEFRPGWRIGDRILRPARVRVGRLAQA
jgi:molecular chaperone GrpE